MKTQNNKPLRVLIIALLVMASGTAFCQKTNFSGTYAFKDQQSISGNLYANGVPKQMTVKQDAKQVSIEKITSGETTDVTVNEAFSLDGKPSTTITPSKRKKVISANWSDDGLSFTEITNFYSAADNTVLEHKVTDTWTMADGQLVLDRKDENLGNGEVWESKATYEKQ